MKVSKPSKAVVVFVHGFGSSAQCWDKLLSLLQADEQTKNEYEFVRFNYPTQWFNFNPFHRIPRLKELAELLEAFLFPAYSERELTLVGHSQGGLVIQSFLVNKLLANQGESLGSIRQVILLATPNEGSTLFSPLRKLLSHLVFNPQERILRVLNEDIGDIRKVMIERVLGAKTGSNAAWPVPIHSFYGLLDGVVPEASAKGPFDIVTPVQADHFSILQPKDHSDPHYKSLANALLVPRGHNSVFEVDRYEASLTVEPSLLKQDFPVKHGITERVVHSDNIARLHRSVSFTQGNRCQSLFTIRYLTKKQGYVRPTYMSAENEADPTETGRYEADGTEVIFKFTPSPGETFGLELEIYKGFDKGNRDVHFHLPPNSYYNKLCYTLDLKRYLEAGYVLAQKPTLYFHSHDPKDHDLCAKRGPGDQVDPVKTEAAGVWSWELNKLRQGVVDVVWEVADPAKAANA